MNLELRSIIEPGNIRLERLTLRVKSALDIGDFLVAQVGWVGSEPSIQIYHTFWFPYDQITAGDLVIIYTREGTPSKKALKAGNTAHFFYWGLDNPIWANDFRGAAVMHVPEWKARIATELYRPSSP
ncbi:hypothetical protein [Mesorhizobium sp. BR-1-1-10]|uniref:hypothetical protein n=1 Tax=Mesorhizobium sp. BR-1-1-10 TaxID=2876660 RepID=UPI001CD09C6F|nr:hypothetical protein [Mesorhizobium sp. BR-1-1-10]MBZ9975494.1 hypothetical protein [Mesorhizobium sp. BR-1-1-10]